MGELGAGAGSSYPGTLDTDSTLEVASPSASKTLIRAASMNDANAAIVAIETELGTDPAGTLSDVKTFLQTEHNTNGTQKVSADYAADAGSTDAYVITLAPTPAGVAGLRTWFKANTANTGPATLNVNGLGAIPLVKQKDVALGTGDILAGQIIAGVYDGTNIQIIPNTPIPAGTVTDFFQAAAPVGWTQVTTQNNKALRVVSGAGGGVGGITAFDATWVGKNTATGGVAHAHGAGGTFAAAAGGNSVWDNVNSASYDGSHVHNISAYEPQYIDVILASKN